MSYLYATKKPWCETKYWWYTSEGYINNIIILANYIWIIPATKEMQCPCFCVLGEAGPGGPQGPIGEQGIQGPVGREGPSGKTIALWFTNH